MYHAVTSSCTTHTRPLQTLAGNQPTVSIYLIIYNQSIIGSYMKLSVGLAAQTSQEVKLSSCHPACWSWPSNWALLFKMPSLGKVHFHKVWAKALILASPRCEQSQPSQLLPKLSKVRCGWTKGRSPAADLSLTPSRDLDLIGVMHQIQLHGWTPPRFSSHLSSGINPQNWICFSFTPHSVILTFPLGDNSKDYWDMGNVASNEYWAGDQTTKQINK